MANTFQNIFLLEYIKKSTMLLKFLLLISLLKILNIKQLTLNNILLPLILLYVKMIHYCCG